MKIRSLALLAILGLLVALPASAAPQVFVEHTITDHYAGAQSVYATDIDGDGDTDVVAPAFRADKMTWWENTGGSPPSFIEHTIRSDWDGAGRVYATDVDGDGDTDVVGGAIWAGEITWWESNPSGNDPPADPIAWTEHTIQGGLTEPSHVYATDVDSDGDTDVLAAHHGSPTHGGDIIWWENNPSGNPPPADPIIWTEHFIKADWQYAAHLCARDVDGDGDTDVVGAATVAHELIWWENSASGNDPPADPIMWTEHIIRGAWHSANWVYATDVDGDGDTDVLATQYHQSGRISWFESKPSGDAFPADPISWTEHIIKIGWPWAQSVYASDVDGDADNDVLGTTSWGGDVIWWENIGGSPPSFTEHRVRDDFYNGAEVYATDVDGDGDTDILGAGSEIDHITWWENMGPPAITATVDIDPDTLNLKSKGRWVTAYVELPEGCDVPDIDVGTVLLDDAISAEAHPTEVGDHDGDGIPDLMVKFSRQDLIPYLTDSGLTSGDVELTVTGEVGDTPFEGSDTIRVK